jgi:signal transduction histidine kinase
VDTPQGRTGLDADAVHTLSNHLAVILGFVELVLTVTTPDDPRHADLVEIREAAHECARIVSRSHSGESA